MKQDTKQDLQAAITALMVAINSSNKMLTIHILKAVIAACERALKELK